MNNYLLRRIKTVGFCVLVSLFLFGFQNSRVESEQGNYVISMEFLTSPVKTGMNTIRVIVYDRKSREPIHKKLRLEVIPWMPINVHAGNEVPIVEYKGKGEYVIEKVNFDAVGDWEVYIKLKNGSEEDTAVFNVSVIGQ
jgi:hypothetical protein